MNFPFRMALRELRRGRRRFVFFLLCIAVGVAGLVGVKGFNANLQSALLKEARTLMAADLKMSVNKPADEQQQNTLTTLKQRGIQVVHVTETVSMAVNPVNQESQLVEVKAVEPGYPFYGALEMNPAGPLTDETALVGADLLDKLGLKAGDTLKLGSAAFPIAGVITKEPDRVTAGFGVGPRVMVTQGGLARAKLIQLGSRQSESYLFRLTSDQQVQQVRADLQAAFEGNKPRLADFREAQPQIKRFLDRMTSFLSLVSMVALLVGGLGVANATRVFIQQKLDAIAVMKCLGATNRKVAAVYLTQMLMLSLAGSILGVALGFGIQILMPKVVGNFLDLSLEITLSPVVALQGLLVGLLTSVLFTLLPLTSIADVKPALVFRREMAEPQNRPPLRTRTREGALLAAVGLGLALISAWVSGSVRWGFWFMGGLAAAVLLLWGAAALMVRLTRAIKVPRKWLTVRQGLASLHRPGSQAGAVVLALGVGVTMVLAIFLLQRGLMREVQLASPAGAPNMFFLGLQTPEVPEFVKLMKADPNVAEVPAPIPLVRGRLLKVNGQTAGQLNLTQEEERWFNYQFNLTFSQPLPPGSELLAGRWWTPEEYESRPLASVEQEAANRLHLTVGSTVEMDLEGGNPVKAEVMNIRRTTDFRAGGSFNFIFSHGGLKDVPVTYLAQARVQPAAAGAVQKSLMAKFPALTVINLNEVLETVGSVMDRIALVIRFVAGFSVAAGLIILASSIAATKFRRTREAVLYKTLGATRRKVWQIFAMEYAALGLVAGIVGAGLSAVAAWGVLRWVMEVKYVPEVMPLLAGVGITVVLTVAVGVLSTLDVLAARPLQVLREE
jgi:putative ABC transport system permease protein